MADSPLDPGRLETVSLWMATKQMPTFEQLAENRTADVCIVGAGIAGLTTAYLLTQRGLSVIVLDDGPIISGETRRTTAHITNAIDDRYYEMIRIHGEERAMKIAESETAAIAQIEEIIHKEHIRCAWERLDGYLFPAPDSKPDLLEKELEAAHRAGLTTVERDTLPLPALHAPCLRFPEQGMFHPTMYLAGLTKAITANGGAIHAFSGVTEVQDEKAPLTVTTVDGKTVTAQALVIATNAPINDTAAIFSKQAPYRTYVVGMSVPKDVVPRALYWDMHDPYHYMRLAEEHDDETKEILIVGGEDHRSGEANDADERYSRLEAWARQHVPECTSVRYRWSGQVMETIDGIAMIGQRPGGHVHSFIATGDSGMGMTHGTIAGMLLADLITGRANPWKDIFDPSRMRSGALTTFLQENASTAKDMATDYVTAGDVKNADAIGPGEGAIARKGLTKIALYRDTDGTLYKRSAVCPHKGCMIRWNSGEKSWDCPCHGSRYNAFGEVLNGPTRSALPPA